MNLHRYKVADLQVPGIYFLFRDGGVVYIGQSKDVYGRIRNHAWPSSKTKHAYRGGFTEYAVIEIRDEVERLAAEKRYIEKCRPEGNRLESRNRRAFMDILSPRPPVPVGAGGGT